MDFRVDLILPCTKLIIVIVTQGRRGSPFPVDPGLPVRCLLQPKLAKLISEVVNPSKTVRRHSHACDGIYVQGV